MSIPGKANRDVYNVGYTGRLMDCWIMYSIFVLKISIPLCMVAHYCLFPMAMIYPGSVLKGKDGFGVALALICIGIIFIYLLDLVTNCFLNYSSLIYFILSKFHNYD
jgi:hypothetical protein